MLQIIHSRGDHWIAVSSLHSDKEQFNVSIYDSVYDSLDSTTKETILTLFDAIPQNMQLLMAPLQKQVGGVDCGLFSIAVITALAFHVNPANITFDQAAMRKHLVSCFETQYLRPFPTL